MQQAARKCIHLRAATEGHWLAGYARHDPPDAAVLAPTKRTRWFTGRDVLAPVIKCSCDSGFSARVFTVPDPKKALILGPKKSGVLQTWR